MIMIGVGRRIIILGVLISTLMIVLMVVSGPIQSQRFILTTLPADTAGLPTHWRCCVCRLSVYLFVWISALSTQNSGAPPRPPTYDGQVAREERQADSDAE
jgi:hypothetical protein